MSVIKTIIEVILVWVIGGTVFYIGIEQNLKHDVPHDEQKYQKGKVKRIIGIVIFVSAVIIQILSVFEVIMLPQPYAFVLLFLVIFLCLKSISEHKSIQKKMKFRAITALCLCILIFAYFIFLPQFLDVTETLLNFNNEYYGLFTAYSSEPMISVMNFKLSIVNCIVIGGAIIFFLVVSIIYFKKGIAAKRIYSKMNGDCGKKIKKYVPQNAASYIIYDDCIHFKVFGKEEVIFMFNQIQMTKLPDECVFPFFDWFYNNMIVDKSLYKYEPITSSYWTGGTSGYYQTTKAYDGYRTSYVSGDSGHEETNTIGWKITSLKFIEEKKRQKLKTW